MKKKAIGLFSGGLDSLLATRLIIDQGFDVICLIFDLWRFPENKNEKHRLEDIVLQLGATFHLVNLADEFLPHLAAPLWGYGTSVNPCIDCKYLMMKKAAEIMKTIDAEFVFTGEVLGQRPMTQKKVIMNMLEKKSGLNGRLLRPLCAKLLEPTIPEKEGIVDRSLLLDIQGRGRSRQIKLAADLGIKEFESPGGGCLLTKKEYAPRLMDFLKNNEKELEAEDVEILKYGRHFRISNRAKVIVGRDEKDNKYLEAFIPNRKHLIAADFEGPLTLLEGEPNEDDIRIAASIAARYGRGKNEKSVNIKIISKDKEEIVEVVPIQDSFLAKYILTFNRKEIETYLMTKKAAKYSSIDNDLIVS